MTYTPEQIAALKNKYNRMKKDPSQLQMFTEEVLDILEEIVGGGSISTLSYEETMAVLDEQPEQTEE